MHSLLFTFRLERLALMHSFCTHLIMHVIAYPDHVCSSISLFCTLFYQFCIHKSQSSSYIDAAIVAASNLMTRSRFPGDPDVGNSHRFDSVNRSTVGKMHPASPTSITCRFNPNASSLPTPTWDSQENIVVDHQCRIHIEIITPQHLQHCGTYPPMPQGTIPNAIKKHPPFVLKEDNRLRQLLLQSTLRISLN